MKLFCNIKIIMNYCKEQHRSFQKALRVDCFVKIAMLDFTDLTPVFKNGETECYNCYYCQIIKQTIKTSSDYTATRTYQDELQTEDIFLEALAYLGHMYRCKESRAQGPDGDDLVCQQGL